LLYSNCIYFIPYLIVKYIILKSVLFHIYGSVFCTRALGKNPLGFCPFTDCGDTHYMYGYIGWLPSVPLLYLPKTQVLRAESTCPASMCAESTSTTSLNGENICAAFMCAQSICTHTAFMPAKIRCAAFLCAEITCALLPPLSNVNVLFLCV
jgi:hypothetical protein